MKKLFLSIAVMAAGLTSCSQSDVSDGVVGAGETTITVAAVLPAEPNGTRSGEGTEVNRCQMEIYLDGTLCGERQTAEVAGGTARFEARLVAGKTYDFVFWADAAVNDGDVHYDTSDFSNIVVKDLDAYAGNDETRDAFFGKETVEITASAGIGAQLRRPFGQLNIKTLDMAEVLTANIGGVVPSHVSIAFKAVPTGINLLTGELTDAAEAVAYAEKAAVIDSEGSLSMDYIFAPKGEEQYLADFTMSFFNAEGGEAAADYEFTNIPVQRNYRTNVSGNLLTKKTDIDVDVVPDFGGDIDVDNLWDGSVEDPEVNTDEKTIIIKTAAELAGLAEMVNAGNSLSGYTVSLAEDIDLANLEWTPIGKQGAAFNGTFDGGNKTVSNLKITGGSYLGLFGSTAGGKLQNLTLDGVSVTGDQRLGALAGNLYTSDAENITVKNAVFNGHHYIGGITGYSYGALVNCKVEGLEAVCTPWIPEGNTSYDDGDKVGGIVGWFASDDITGCSVSNAVIKGYRDTGGIAGYVGKDGRNPVVMGNNVSNAAITVDQQTNFYSSYDANGGEIIGRFATASMTYANNTYDNVTLSYIGCTSGVAVGTASAAQSAVEKGGEVVVKAAIDKIDLTASTPLRPLTLVIEEPVGEIVLGTRAENPAKTVIEVKKDVAYPVFSVVRDYDIKNLEIKGDLETSQGCAGLTVRNLGVAAVDGLTFNGVLFKGHGVDLGFGANPQITKNIVFENCEGVDLEDHFFIVSHNRYAGTEVGDITISNCKMSFAAGASAGALSDITAIDMRYMTGGTVSVENCEIVGSPKHGIMFADFEGEVIVRGNTVTDCFEDGVKVDNPKGSILIEGNTLKAQEFGVRVARFLADVVPSVNISANKFDMTSVKNSEEFNAVSVAGSTSSAVSAVLVVKNNVKVAGNVDEWLSINGSVFTAAAGSDIATPFAE